MRHAGDLGNLQADGEGKVRHEITVKIFPSRRRIPSWAAALFNAKVDDGGQPVGNAGARISCGVISRESCQQIGARSAMFPSTVCSDQISDFIPIGDQDETNLSLTPFLSHPMGEGVRRTGLRHAGG